MPPRDHSPARMSSSNGRQQAVIRRAALDMEGSNHGSNFTRRGSGLEGRTPGAAREVSAQSTNGRGAGPRAGGPVPEEQMPLKGTNGRIKQSGDGGWPEKDKGEAPRTAQWLWELDRRSMTSFWLNAAMLFERTDEVVLPAIYKFVAASFNATLTQLGILTLARALSQALFSPLGGVLGHYYNRTWVITLGCAIWGLSTTAFAFSTDLGQGIASWAITGIGLCLVIPNAQSLTADYYQENDRGKAFGILHLTSAAGAALGGLYATNLGARTPFGWEGWRLAILLLGIVSSGIGVFNFFLSRDPRCPSDGLRLEGGGESDEKMSMSQLWGELRSVVTIPTFLIIVSQGIMGNIPGTALGFATLYLQLLGISDFWASMMVSLGMGAHACGGLIGGWLGDGASRHYPNHGRIAVCQLSVILGTLTNILLLLGLPQHHASSYIPLYIACFIGMGLVNSWAAPACNNPIFAEIVPENSRNIIYAFDRSFEMAIAAACNPVVGILAEKLFGFDGTATTSGDVDVDTAKAVSLSHAMVIMTAVPGVLCCLIYSAVHFTYPKDKRRILMKGGQDFVQLGSAAESLTKEGSAHVGEREEARRQLMHNGTRSDGEEPVV